LAAKAAVFGAVAVVTGELVSWVAFLRRSAHDQRAPAHGLSRPARRGPGCGRRRAVHRSHRAYGRCRRHHLAVHGGGHHRRDRCPVRAPGVLEALPNSWRLPVEKYWPTGAGEQVLMVTRDANTLPAWLGFGELALFVAVLLALGYFLLQRRDAEASEIGTAGDANGPGPSAPGWGGGCRTPSGSPPPCGAPSSGPLPLATPWYCWEVPPTSCTSASPAGGHRPRSPSPRGAALLALLWRATRPEATVIFVTGALVAWDAVSGPGTNLQFTLLALATYSLVVRRPRAAPSPWWRRRGPWSRPPGC